MDIDKDIEFAQRVIEGKCLDCESIDLAPNRNICFECIAKVEYKIFKSANCRGPHKIIRIIDRWEKEGILTYMGNYDYKHCDDHL